MSSRSRQKGVSALTVPGPAPWYLAAPEVATLQTSRGVWTWQSSHRAELETSSCLRAPDGSAALVVSMGCYVLPLPNDRLLVWYERRRDEVSGVDRPGISFIVLSLNELQPLADPKAAARELRSTKRRAVFEGGSPATLEVPTDVGEGVHAMTTPATFLDAPEILVLAEYGSEPSNHFDKMFLAIFAFDFRAGKITVLPQRWYNEGPYDFMYQWITRVQRNAATGRIVGEGIRLGNFRLDASGMQIETWLDEEFRPLEQEP